MRSSFPVEEPQLYAWKNEIDGLRQALSRFEFGGSIYFEFPIPRIGSRADVVLILKHVLFVLEYKVGEQTAHLRQVEQVTDYALDLKNFHESSYDKIIAPVLVLSRLKSPATNCIEKASDNVVHTLVTDQDNLADTLTAVLQQTSSDLIASAEWEAGRYYPSPTIVEAAKALYSGHSVTEISRSDSGAQNLAVTANYVASLIESARQARGPVRMPPPRSRSWHTAARTGPPRGRA